MGSRASCTAGSFPFAPRRLTASLCSGTTNRLVCYSMLLLLLVIVFCSTIDVPVCDVARIGMPHSANCQRRFVRVPCKPSLFYLHFVTTFSNLCCRQNVALTFSTLQQLCIHYSMRAGVVINQNVCKLKIIQSIFCSVLKLGYRYLDSAAAH